MHSVFVNTSNINWNASWTFGLLIGENEHKENNLQNFLLIHIHLHSSYMKQIIIVWLSLSTVPQSNTHFRLSISIRLVCLYRFATLNKTLCFGICSIDSAIGANSITFEILSRFNGKWFDFIETQSETYN